jgi:hypothetical protein
MWRRHGGKGIDPQISQMGNDWGLGSCPRDFNFWVPCLSLDKHAHAAARAWHKISLSLALICVICEICGCIPLLELISLTAMQTGVFFFVMRSIVAAGLG